MDFEEDSTQECLLSVCESTPNNAQVLYKLLLEALRSKNFHSFKNIIEYHTKTSILNVNYVYPNIEETLLDIASKNGQTKFVEFLLYQGAKPNRVNVLHDRAPIHFATEGEHANTLAALLEEPTINPNLQAGYQTALHFAVMKKNLNCAGLLLKKGASVNIPNSQGLTALHLAAMEGQRDMVQLILEKSRQCPDVDTYKDWEDRTTRKVIEDNLPDVLLSFVCEKREVNEQDLKYYLIVNDETNFLKSVELVKTEVLHGEAEELLEMAAQRGFHRATIGILERFKERQFSVKKAAQAAVQRSDHAILQVLLQAEPDVIMADDLIMSACVELGMSGKRGADSTSDRLACLKLILEQENVNVRCSDSKGNTPLHYAARAGPEAVALLLNRGSYIGHMNKFNVPPIANIPAHTLSRYFDKCLQEKKEQSKCVIEFNYRCLMPHDDLVEHARQTTEMKVFKYIASNGGLKQLLKHPLLSSFLFLKWHRIRHALYANLAFYVIFYCVLNAYILSMTYGTRVGNETQIYNGGSDRSLRNTVRVWYQNNSLQTGTAVMLVLFILRELLQLVANVRRYLRSLRNWLEMALITLTVALLCGAGLQVGAILILLSAWELVILISQHPSLATGIEMFRTVSLNFMRFLFPYLFLIFAFSLAFYTLFKDDTNFPNPGLSFFKTAIMFTGEFDANDISFISHPVWSHVVFILFVFFIAIVLFNLLNGLAVNNTAEILSKAELVGLISQTRLVAYIEDVVEFFRHCSCCNSWWNPFGYLTKRIFLFPHFLRDGKISIKLSDSLEAYDNDRNYKWTTLRMDPYIIKQAKCIIYNKNQLTDNERIMNILKKLQEKLMAIENNINNTAKKN